MNRNHMTKRYAIRVADIMWKENKNQKFYPTLPSTNDIQTKEFLY